jgi:3-keto-5-aminohexanoate cleavage enzyme
MKKLIIEVAINETIMRSENPHVPLTAEEIAEDAYQCFLEGATIIHFHNRTPGYPDDGTYDSARNGDHEAYAETMRLIAGKCDLIPYPTMVYPGAPGREEALRQMHPHVKALRTMDVGLETFVLPVGATNIGRYDFKGGKFVYDRASHTSHEQMAGFLEWCMQSGLQPGFIVREPGHMRHLLMYREMGLLRDPIIAHLNLSDSVPYGPKPDVTGIQSLISIIPPEVPLEWFIHNYTSFVHDTSLGDSHRELNVLAIAMGGHARTGIGDKAVWDGKRLTNAQMVRHMRNVAEAAGREIATTDEARQILGYSKLA